MMPDNNKILEKSIKNLRENLDSLSMDKVYFTLNYKNNFVTRI